MSDKEIRSSSLAYYMDIRSFIIRFVAWPLGIITVLTSILYVSNAMSNGFENLFVVAVCYYGASLTFYAALIAGFIYAVVHRIKSGVYYLALLLLPVGKFALEIVIGMIVSLFIAS